MHIIKFRPQNWKTMSDHGNSGTLAHALITSPLCPSDSLQYDVPNKDIRIPVHMTESYQDNIFFKSHLYWSIYTGSQQNVGSTIKLTFWHKNLRQHIVWNIMQTWLYILGTVFKTQDSFFSAKRVNFITFVLYYIFFITNKLINMYLPI